MALRTKIHFTPTGMLRFELKLLNGCISSHRQTLSFNPPGLRLARGTRRANPGLGMCRHFVAYRTVEFNKCKGTSQSTRSRPSSIGELVRDGQVGSTEEHGYLPMLETVE